MNLANSCSHMQLHLWPGMLVNFHFKLLYLLDNQKTNKRTPYIVRR